MLSYLCSSSLVWTLLIALNDAGDETVVIRRRYDLLTVASHPTDEALS